MVSIEMSKWVVSLLLGACAACLVAGETTPVFLWTNKGTLPDVSVPAGQHMSNPDFNRHVIDHLVNKAKGNIVALLQDKLKLNDITKYADVYSENSNGNLFHNLKKSLEAHTSLELPSVHDAHSAIQELASTFQGPVHHLKAPYDLSQLSLDGKQRHLVLVHLPESEKDEKAFQKNDEILGRLSNQLEKLGQPYTAMYTGKPPSKVGPAESLYMGRHLLQATTLAPSTGPMRVLFNYSGCSYIYMTGLKVEVMEQKPDDDKNPISAVYTRNLVQDSAIKLDFTGNSCNMSNKRNASLKFSAAPEGNLTRFDVSMDFFIETWDWTLVRFNVNYEVKGDSKTYQGTPDMDTSNIGAAKGFSYHCTDLTPVVPLKPKTPGKVTQFLQLTFKDLQMQIQTTPITSSKFGASDDCVGFFTIPIWSGIITAIILTSILAYGILMIMNISTMDRFDDPKGKTITVNVAE